jgi:hypothetical protein
MSVEMTIDTKYCLSAVVAERTPSCIMRQPHFSVFAEALNKSEKIQILRISGKLLVL